MRKLLITLVSLAFIVCAAFSVMLLRPAAASAETADHDEHSGWMAITENGGTLSGGNYYLTDDVTLNTNLTISGTVTLCLNGYKLTGTGSGSVITVNSGANFTLCDCNGSNGEHKYNIDETTGLYKFEENGTETLTGGVITGGTSTTAAGGVYVSGGTFTMNGGTIAGNTSTTAAGGVYVMGGMSSMSSATFTMNGGTISGNTSTTVAGGVYVTSGMSSATFTMNGGTISGNTSTMGAGGVYMTVNTGSATFTMNGGTINDLVGGDSSATITVAGGTFSNEAWESLKTLNATLPPEGDIIKNENGVVIQHTHRDESGAITETFTTLTSAGGELTGGTADEPVYYALLGDVTLTQNITITGNVTLCLNGYMLKGTGTGSVITISEGANFTLCDCNTTTEHKYSVNADGLYVFEETGTNALYGGVITGGKAADGGGVYMGDHTAFLMQGGTIAGNISEGWKGGGGVCVGYTGTSEQDAVFTLQNGAIVGNTASNYGDAVLVNNGATFNMQGGTLDGFDTLYYDGHSDGTISGGTVKGSFTVYGGGTEVVIEDGTFESVDNGGTISCDQGIITINGGTFNIQLKAPWGPININGGYFNEGVGSYCPNGRTHNITINGGYFSENAIENSESYLFKETGSDYSAIPTNNMAGYYAVVPYQDPNNPHKHGEQEFTSVLTYAGGTLTDGYYYLAADTELDNNITITGTVTLCLNGYKLTGNGSGSVITVSGGANFTLCDCNGSGSQHKYNIDETSGRYVFSENGVQTLTGGVITGGSASIGGGVNVESIASFTLNSGTIAGNIASTGGGVNVGVGATFEMTGGTIIGNWSSLNGGGVYVNTGAKLEMSDGSIVGNRSNGGGGGGVYNFGTFTMSGGSISGNSTINGGYGAGVYQNGTMNVSGSPVITGNIANDSDEENVYLPSGKTINLESALDSGATIGITLAKDYSGAFTTGTGDASTYFTSDQGGKVELKDGVYKIYYEVKIESSGDGKGSITGNNVSGDILKVYYGEDAAFTATPTVGFTGTMMLDGKALTTVGTVTWAEYLAAAADGQSTLTVTFAKAVIPEGVFSVDGTYTYTGEEIKPAYDVNESIITDDTLGEAFGTWVLGGASGLSVEYADNIAAGINSAKIILTFADDSDFKFADGNTLTLYFTIEKATLEDKTVDDVNGTYSGTAYGFDIALTGFVNGETAETADGFTVEYSKDQSDWSENPITATKVAESCTVYYRVTSKNYNTVEGSVVITIKKAELPDGAYRKVFDRCQRRSFGRVSYQGRNNFHTRSCVRLLRRPYKYHDS